MIEHSRTQDGSGVRISVTDDRRTLIEVSNIIRGVNGGLPNLSFTGMSTRCDDLESSYDLLSGNFINEVRLVLDCIGLDFNNLDFRKKAKDYKVHLHMHGTTRRENGEYSIDFATRELGSALRHYINDYCRILEPLVKLMAEKLSVNGMDRRNEHYVSFNNYIERLERENIKLPFDSIFIKNIYSIWNDYKHSDSMGPSATEWSFSREKLVSTPNILSLKNTYFEGTMLEDFLETSLVQLCIILQFLMSNHG